LRYAIDGKLLVAYSFAMASLKQKWLTREFITMSDEDYELLKESIRQAGSIRILMRNGDLSPNMVHMDGTEMDQSTKPANE